MNRLPQDILLNFQLEFPKSDLTIYLPFGISDFFCQMVSTPGLPPDQVYKSQEQVTDAITHTVGSQNWCQALDLPNLDIHG